ncbi:hypothetical protein SpiGrapes_1610 [Sphaerochaeta pleomorpha str. Grapes]|uniref:Uncharacterized protein n=1 Tax=Sphaerochaeta pleomorpha (strain ATCC BAA-1885 / DSM 22778 / Grapes) TaxID=158190 RepID=G8QWB9_SPHPG|nr:hypothetical protein [Sphaerochaeta pleomorpha]AEV29417.1 hypothetical protein SpiGrapes_1610 [Sphaerochaeta pleomorpha str. Grapes]
MYQKQNDLIFGFHGCDEKLRDEIVNNQKKLHRSTNSYDWLGLGMYFWENNPLRALQWAETMQKHPQNGKRKTENGKQKIDKPSVLGAVICPGQCLDFLSSENIKLLSHAYAFLSESSNGQTLPANKGNGLIRDLDCAVIQMLITLQEEQQNKKNLYDSVRGVFLKVRKSIPLQDSENRIIFKYV